MEPNDQAFEVLPGKGLAIFEEVDLTLSLSRDGTAPLGFFQDELKDNAIYCCHSSGSHYLEFPWVKGKRSSLPPFFPLFVFKSLDLILELSAYFRDGSATSGIPEKRGHSKIMPTSQQDPEVIFGFALVTNSYVGYAVIALSRTFKVSALDILPDPENLNFAEVSVSLPPKSTPLSNLVESLGELSKKSLPIPSTLRKGEPVDILALRSLAEVSQELNKQYVVEISRAHDAISHRSFRSLSSFPPPFDFSHSF